MLKAIGKKIRKKRILMAYSIEELAEYSETSFSTISRIELGKITDIHFSTLVRILHALDLDFTIEQPESAMTVGTKELVNYLESLPLREQEETSTLLLKLLKVS